MESYCNAFRFLQLNEPAAIADRPGRRLQELPPPQAGLSVGPNPLAGFEAMHVVLKFHTETFGGVHLRYQHITGAVTHQSSIEALGIRRHRDAVVVDLDLLCRLRDRKS